MSKDNPVRIYFDSCVYFPLFEKDKDLKENYLDIIGPAIDRKEAMLITSTILDEEIIKANTPESQYPIIQGIMNSPNVYKVNEDFLFNIRLRELIDRSKQSNEIKKTPILKDDDARHLQSAIIAGADEFHTFDTGVIGLDYPTLTPNNKIKVISPNESELLSGYLV